ncbi:DUF6234 family protein [Streptomyces sp. W1SF4]|uniref:DUF6234 family protein n=1 Tax=Streptomyces sp. W1SF4 TaxID=2305220 RepID=UPI000F6E98A4|nr:DUF6234 family protein [Streptomyces sp. W1SF4]AZM88670.1 hypothetical protein D1J60_09380 [Streptomyces sp. W1SF4]
MSTTTAAPERRRDLGADIAGAVGLVIVELVALAGVFVVWVLTGLDLDPVTEPEPHPVWGYLVAAGVLAALMARVALRASRRGAGVTAVTQSVMAMATVTAIVMGAAYQVHEDRPAPTSPCRDSPSAPWCNG